MMSQYMTLSLEHNLSNVGLTFYQIHFNNIINKETSLVITLP